MFRLFLNSAIILLLTLLTQIGGAAWLAALLFRRRLLAFVCIYAGLSIAAVHTAPAFGRTALSCWDQGSLQVQSWFYCALNRNFVTAELADVLRGTADAVNAEFPGTVTLVLDANFPFLDGFPLLPHLSHDDGEKADLAFYYADGGEYVPAAVRSPVGYFAFEQGPTSCPPAWPTLRWDFGLLQGLWRDMQLEPDRTAYVLNELAADPRVAKIFLEPHLKSQLGIVSDKVRFQGCRAARHDDHIHFQL